MRFRIMFFFVLFIFPLTPQAFSDTGPLKAPPSFFQLVGDTDWQVNLKDFTVSTEKDGNIFVLRTGDENYLSFSAYPKDGGKTESFGPLLTKYSPTLVELMNYAMKFGEVEKKGVFSVNVDWELYPESIRDWALVWKESDLREKWKDMGHQEGYPLLVTMITRQLKKDFQPVFQVMGFETAGASMEKMAFQEVRKLPYYKEMLKPAGIPADLELPLPLILSIRMKALGPAPLASPENPNPVTVDSLFATAQSSSSSLYCSFQRALDEYAVSGDRLNQDGSYTRLLPLSQKAYRTMAAQLLKAALQATNGDERASCALRLDLSLYPEVYRETVKRFTFSPQQARKAEVPRPQLPKLRFFVFEPSPSSGFSKSVNSFLKSNGYEFGHLLLSVEKRRKAGSFPAYTKNFLPLGIQAGDTPAVPDIVYMIVEKRKGQK